MTLRPATSDYDLDGDNVRREVEPMIALVNDVQDSMNRDE